MSRAGTFYQKVWQGTDSPDPKHRSENPYNSSVRLSVDTPITWSFTGNPTIFSGTPESCGFAPTHAPFIYPDDQELILLSKMVDKVREHSFNAAIALGEGRESVQMIASTARALGRSFLSLKRLDVVSAFHHLGLTASRGKVSKVERAMGIRNQNELSISSLRSAAANGWLSLTWGWQPLVKDASESATALAKSVTNSFNTTVHKSRAVPIQSYGSGGGFSAAGLCIARRTYVFKLREPESSLSALGFTRPETLVWELLPFTAVADWFIPIGKYLEVTSSLRNFKGDYIRSTKFHADLTMGTSPSYVVHSGSSHRIEVDFERAVGSISSLAVPLPRVKNPLSVRHAVTAIALLQQIFRG